MRRGHHWDRLFGNVDAVLEAGSIDIGKALNQEWRRFVRDIEQDVISAAAFHFVINGARHHIARGQVAPLRVVVLHERRAVGMY